MSILLPVLAVAGESFGKIIDKFNFNKTGIKPVQLIFLIFSGMFMGLLVYFLITRESFPVLNPVLIFLVLLMICISLAQNLFDFTGLRYKDLSSREPIHNLQPIVTGFIAYLLFPSEREIKYLIAIIIGVIVLYLGNSARKLTVKCDRGTIYLFLGMMCAATLANIYKVGLEFISPSYLFLFRVSGILLLLPFFQRIDFHNLNSTQISYGLTSGFVYFVGFIFRLISIKHLGLNFTILILLLGPSLIYFLSNIVLKEKIQPKKIITSLILVLIVVIAIYL